METMHVLGWFLLTLSFPFSVWSWPNGAGACLEGQASVGGNHLAVGAETGTLQQGGFSLQIEGQTLVENEQVLWLTRVSNTETELSIRLQGMQDENRFRGVLIRVGNATQVLPADGSLQVANVCTSPKVAGVTHRNFQNKQAVSATMVLEDESNIDNAGTTWHRIDVTVVVRNSNGISEYYYSGVMLALRSTVPEEEEPAPPPQNEEEESPLWEVLLAQFDLTWWTQALNQTNTLTTNDNGAVAQTLFAPTDAAIAARAETANYLTNTDWKVHLEYLVQYHVVEAERLTRNDLTQRSTISTLVDEEIQVRQQNGQIIFSSLGFTGSVLVEADLTDVSSDDNTLLPALHKVDPTFWPLALVVDLLGWIQRHPDLSSRTAQLVVFAGMEDALTESERSFWAPTDAAWLQRPDFGQIVANPAMLREILSQHICEGVHPDLTDGMIIRTIANTVLIISLDDSGEKIVNGNAKIQEENHVAANGLGFVVDSVLERRDAPPPTAPTTLPPVTTNPTLVVPETAEPTQAPAANTEAPTVSTIWDIVTEEPRLSQLETALVQTSVSAALKLTDVTLTLFAPVDTAWDVLDDKYWTNDNWKPHLERILLYHTAVGDAIRLQDLGEDIQIVTLVVPPEAPIEVNVDGDEVSFSGPAFNNSRIVREDLVAGNGVIQMIDRIFLPESLAIPLLQWVVASPDLQRFSESIVTVGLEEELKTPDRTAFVPSDAAWGKIFLEQQEIASDLSQLAWIISNHICDGVFAEENLADAFELTTISNQVLRISIEDSVRTVNGATIEIANKVASNGLGFVVDEVLLPEQPAPTAAPAPGEPSSTPTSAPVTNTPTSSPTLLLDPTLSPASFMPTPSPVVPTPTPTELATNTPTSAPTADDESDLLTVFDVIVRESDLSVLETAIRLTGVDMLLMNFDSNLTVFAPVDNVMRRRLDNKFLTRNWRPHLKHILLYHFTGIGVFLTSDMVDGMEIVSMAPAEEPILTNRTGDDVSFSGPAFSNSGVVLPDLIARNGVVHKLGNYFLPEVLTVDLLQWVRSTAEFGVLYQLVAEAGLEDELTMDDRTFFVPSRSAWGELSQDLLDEIAADTEFLRSLLSRHICEGVYPFDLLTNGAKLTTISGSSLTVSIEGVEEKFVGGAKIGLADQLASNGLGFVIDAVLVPPKVTFPPSSAPTRVDDGSPTTYPTAPKIPSSSIVHTVADEDDLSTLDTAIRISGLEDRFRATYVNFTLFAPTDQAFESLDEKYLSENWRSHLELLLLYHVSGTGAIAADDFMHGMRLLMLAPTEAPLIVSLSGSILSLIGPAFGRSQVVDSDLRSVNGIVHKVDEVFVPEALTVNILDVTRNALWFDQLAKLIVVSAFDRELNTADRTFFAPSNEAFARLPSGTLDALNPEQITAILSNHLCEGVYPDVLLVYGLELTTIANRTLSITGLGSGGFAEKFVSGAPISFTNDLASNGIVHTIEGVLLPPLPEASPTRSPNLTNTRSPVSVAPSTAMPSTERNNATDLETDTASKQPSPTPSYETSSDPTVAPTTQERPATSTPTMPQETSEPTAQPIDKETTSAPTTNTSAASKPVALLQSAVVAMVGAITMAL